MIEHGAGRAELAQLAGVEDRHAVGDDRRLVAVVGHEQRRGAARREDVAQVGEQLRAAGGVQAAEWLVEEEEPGLQHERPRDADALCLPAGQRQRTLSGQSVEPEARQPVVGAPPALLPWHPGESQPRLHVGAHGGRAA